MSRVSDGDEYEYWGDDEEDDDDQDDNLYVEIIDLVEYIRLEDIPF